MLINKKKAGVRFVSIFLLPPRRAAIEELMSCRRCQVFRLLNCDFDHKINKPCSSCKSQRKICSQGHHGSAALLESHDPQHDSSALKVIPPVLPLLGSLYTDTPELYMSCIDNARLDACPILASASFPSVHPPPPPSGSSISRFKFGKHLRQIVQ